MKRPIKESRLLRIVWGDARLKSVVLITLGFLPSVSCTQRKQFDVFGAVYDGWLYPSGLLGFGNSGAFRGLGPGSF